MPLDMVKDGDTDIQDLLRGDAALLDAAKKGCLARVQKLCSPENINCRDTQGRNSTPLHLAGNTHTHIYVYEYIDVSSWLDAIIVLISEAMLHSNTLVKTWLCIITVFCVILSVVWVTYTAS